MHALPPVTLRSGRSGRSGRSRRSSASRRSGRSGRSGRRGKKHRRSHVPPLDMDNTAYLMMREEVRGAGDAEGV